MKYNGKYSLVENLFKGRFILTEANISPDQARKYVTGLRVIAGLQPPVSGDPITDGTFDAGQIGEAFAEEWLGGDNLNTLSGRTTFEFADVVVGDPQDLSNSEDGPVNGLTFYSVKTMTQEGVFDVKQKMNADGFARDCERYLGAIRPDQQEVHFNWGVYTIGLDETGERLQLTKFGPINITCNRLPSEMKRGETTSTGRPSPQKETGWVCTSASKRPGKSRDQVNITGDMNSMWNGNHLIRGAGDLAAAMGITPELKLESDPFPGMGGDKPYESGSGNRTPGNPNRGRPGYTR